MVRQQLQKDSVKTTRTLPHTLGVWQELHTRSFTFATWKFRSICISSLKTIQIWKLGKGYNFLNGDCTLSLLVIYPWFSPIVKAGINCTLIGCLLWYRVSIISVGQLPLDAVLILWLMNTVSTWFLAVECTTCDLLLSVSQGPIASIGYSYRQ